jgi:OmpA-OmpF porin, OOP family
LARAPSIIVRTLLASNQHPTGPPDMTSFHDEASNHTSPSLPGRTAAADRGAPDNIFVGSLLLLGLWLLGWYTMSSRPPAAPPVPPVTVEAPWAAAPSAPATTLPGGTAIRYAENGIESRLLAFVQDSTKPVDKTTWFEFDRLRFETGSAVLQPSSFDQLNNIAEILKAYPKVSLKIGGYTDNVGNAAANMKLSGDRANTAMAELVKLGIAPTRLEAEGYGDTIPLADNSTEEGRAKNRRTAVRVNAK